MMSYRDELPMEFVHSLDEDNLHHSFWPGFGRRYVHFVVISGSCPIQYEIRYQYEVNPIMGAIPSDSERAIGFSL